MGGKWLALDHYVIDHRQEELPPSMSTSAGLWFSVQSK